MFGAAYVRGLRGRPGESSFCNDYNIDTKRQDVAIFAPFKVIKRGDP